MATQRPISEADLTPWFQPDVKPVRVGEYETNESALGVARRWWNGTAWSVFYVVNDPENAKRLWRSLTTGLDDIRWRGLSKKPE